MTMNKKKTIFTIAVLTVLLAACVAQFGMLLRGSEYSGTATYESIAETLAALPGVAEDPYQSELLYLVQQQARKHG